MANNSEKKLNGTVIVTYRCNARCSMCNRYKAPSSRKKKSVLKLSKTAEDVLHEHHRRRTVYPY